ncbi:MAG: hypothetical protein RLP09_10675 [Sandaracinaceae bacterium]|nr:hypothetical protein [Myxococcales bacterium]
MLSSKTAKALIGGAALAVLLPAGALAQDQQPNAQQAMQGGGMTEERQLDDMRAREHFRVATAYYDEGRFVEAAEQFQEAYELSRRAQLLYNAYIAWREAHRSAEAANALETYLAETPEAPDRVNLEARLVELRRAVATEAEREQRLTEAEREAEANRIAAEEAERARRQAVSEPEIWPWIVLGVGGAAVIAGAVVGGLALDEATSLSSECPGNFCPPGTDLDERRGNAQLLAGVADGLLIGGGVVAATGLVLSLIFGLGGDSEQPVSAEAGCGPTGCGVTLRGSF